MSRAIMPLSQKQIRVAELLARGYSQEEAGKAVGASRRSVSRWLQSEEFRNLSYGLIGRTSPSQPSPQPPRRSLEVSGNLSPDALVQSALTAIKDILENPESRASDRLKAATLVGEWSGFFHRSRISEVEAVKLLIESKWVSDDILESVLAAGDEFHQSIKRTLLEKMR